MSQSRKLEGKTALITGGNSGIGFETARLFIAEGARVAITGRDQGSLDAAAKELGPAAFAYRADVLDAKAREQLFQEIGERFGGLDIVFANAGISGATPLGQTETETFQRILDVNVTGVFLTVQAALPLLRSGGSVVLNGSVIASLGLPGYSAYAASKGAVIAMTRVFAAELGQKGIRVNIVSPGATKTPIWTRGRAPEVVTAVEDRLTKAIPLERWGTVEEIAKAVLFLASSDASYVHGIELFVDGGAVNVPGGTTLYR